MKKFLLDSDTCISFIRGNQTVKENIALVSSENVLSLKLPLPNFGLVQNGAVGEKENTV